MSEEHLTHTCFNCGAFVEEKQNYCANCGQKVDNNNLKFKVLLKDFFENYLSFDTQLGRSIFPFFFRPGELSIRFNEGKRKSFANPFRLYLVISVFFFLAVNLALTNNGTQEISLPEPQELAARSDLPEQDRQLLNEQLSNIIIDELNDSSFSSFKEAFAGLNDYRKKKVSAAMRDSLQQALGIPADSTFDGYKPAVTAGYNRQGGFGVGVSDINFKVINKYRYQKDISDAQLVDSLNMGELTARERYIYERSIRAYRKSESINALVLKNMSTAMILVLPISALILMLFYRRTRKYYVEHLIHSIHLHCFVFSIFGLFFFMQYFFDLTFQLKLVLWLFFLLLAIVYSFVSLKRVYANGNRVTLFKMFGVGAFYSITIALFLAADVLISFLFLI
jgi:hypothetical protein